MRSTALANIKRLKDATGGTVNDVVMAICAGALREYLLRHDALPEAPLRAMVPVSIRTGLEEDPWTNRVSSIVCALPTDCDDPVERVARCRAAMEIAKRQLRAQALTAAYNSTPATDARRRRELLVELHRQEQNILVVVTHSPELARLFPRRMEMNDGTLEPAGGGP